MLSEVWVLLITITKYFININTLSLLNFSLVRSKLKFRSFVWFAIYAVPINLYKNVRYKYTKYF